MASPPDHSHPSALLAPSLKLAIMASSLLLASSVGFYLHPHLLPILSESIPHLWSVAQGWLTAPILFLLLNLVVGTLYFSSSLLSRPGTLPQHPLLAPSPSPASSSIAPHDRTPDIDAVPATTNLSKPPGGLRARIEKSKPFLRLVRSKSEQIPPSLREAEASGSRLKKAGTFETAAKGSRKPIVIVADPPEDESGAPPAGHEEVDKKAEDFISRFYHKVKLQRLDSLLRNQQQQGKA